MYSFTKLYSLNKYVKNNGLPIVYSSDNINDLLNNIIINKIYYSIEKVNKIYIILPIINTLFIIISLSCLIFKN